MKNKIKVITVLSVMLGIAALGFWAVNKENLKIRGQFMAYETQQYLAFENTDEVMFSFIIIDGTSKKLEGEKLTSMITLIDKKGNQYAFNKIEKKELEKNRIYSVYEICVEKPELPKGETVFQKVNIKGKELELGNIVVDILKTKEDNFRDTLELGWSPFESGSKYVFSVKSNSDDVSVLKVLYDLEGEGQYKTIEINQSLKKEKEEEISFEVSEFAKKHCSMRPIIEFKKGKNTYRILPPCETSSFHGLTKEEILSYIERKSKNE